MWARVIHASPAPMGGSGSCNTQQAQPFPVEISGRLSRTEDKQERESGPEVRELGYAVQEDALPPPTGIQNWKEREEAGEGCLSSNHRVARTKLIRSGSLK